MLCLDHNVQRTIDRFVPKHVQTFLVTQSICVKALARGVPFNQASSSLRRLGVDVDAWPAPPAGIFVVEDRTVYLRSRSPMTVIHELGHGLDLALGGKEYFSKDDPTLQRCFRRAKSYVTPYAATGIDEYLAEGARAYFEANDPQSFWPRATRARLQRIDPDFFCYLDYLLNVRCRMAPALPSSVGAPA